MYRWAVIDEKTNIVTNVIVWDGIAQWQPPKGQFVVKHDDCDVNDLYDMVEEKHRFTKPILLEVKKEPIE